MIKLSTMFLGTDGLPWSRVSDDDLSLCLKIEHWGRVQGCKPYSQLEGKRSYKE